MIIHDMEQRSDEWYKIRELKLTASNATAIASSGKGLETYTTKIVSEYFSSSEEESYSNKHIERGIELESEARSIYELETSNVVKEVGFIEHSENVGCSPDGLIEKDGGIEIKCNEDKAYTELAISDKVDTTYMWQMQMSILICNCKWWDFVCYNPNYKRSIYIKRITLDTTAQDKLLKGIGKGVEQIKLKIEKMENYLNGNKIIR